MCEVHKSTFKQKNQIVKGFYQVAQRVANKVIRCGLVPKCANCQYVQSLRKRLLIRKAIRCSPIAKYANRQDVQSSQMVVKAKTSLLKGLIKLLNVL